MNEQFLETLTQVAPRIFDEMDASLAAFNKDTYKTSFENFLKLAFFCASITVNINIIPIVNFMLTKRIFWVTSYSDKPHGVVWDLQRINSIDTNFLDRFTKGVCTLYTFQYSTIRTDDTQC